MFSITHRPVSWLAAVFLCAAGAGDLSGVAHAQAGKALGSLENVCLSEARRAEAQHGIPKGLLQSITRVEAGRKTVTGEFMPWAWTLNDSGKGLFFDSREAAMRHLEAAVAAPGHSVDVGCMQVNTKWHMEGFHNLSDMLDPVQNADYAAGFLLDLHEAHQSWDDAVKHYHSSEPEKNIRYHSRVLAELETFLASANGEAMDDAGQVVTPKEGDLELASMTAPSGVSSVMPAPVAPPAPPMPFPMPAPAPLPMEQPMAQPAATIKDDAPGSMSPAMAKQPNLVPHWNRVERFRKLLARQAG